MSAHETSGQTTERAFLQSLIEGLRRSLGDGRSRNPRSTRRKIRDLEKRIRRLPKDDRGGAAKVLRR